MQAWEALPSSIQHGLGEGVVLSNVTVVFVLYVSV
jgi:hypothetical protein